MMLRGFTTWLWGLVLLVAVALGSTVPRPAFSQPLPSSWVVECGPQSGWAYRLPSPASGTQASGWMRDEISPGWTIIQVDGDRANITWKDASRTTSSVTDGFDVMVAAREAQTRSVQLVSVHPVTGTVETYIVQFGPDQTAKMVTTLTRARMLPVARVFAAECRVRG